MTEAETLRDQAARPINGGATFVCETCGGKTIEKSIDVTMWTAKGLILIESVPSYVCESCEAQYYEEVATQQIQTLIIQGFPKEQKKRDLTVPVYTLEGIITGSMPDEVM